MVSKHDTANEEIRVFSVELRHNGAVGKLELLLTQTEERTELVLDLQIICPEKRGETLIALCEEIRIFMADLRPSCAEYVLET